MSTLYRTCADLDDARELSSRDATVSSTRCIRASSSSEHAHKATLADSALYTEVYRSSDFDPLPDFISPVAHDVSLSNYG